jgi:hypothetical protein
LEATAILAAPLVQDQAKARSSRPSMLHRARLVEYIVRAEEAAGVTADENKIPIIVGVPTAEKFGVSGQSRGQIEALRFAFVSGGRLPDGTVVRGNDFLNSRKVWTERFVIGIQSFQFTGEIHNFVQAVWKKYQSEVPILLTEHGFDAVQAALPI